MEKKKTILIIEDEQFLIDLYKKAFTQRNFEVLGSVDGIEGLGKANNNPNIDMILLDIMLPKMDGISVLRKIKENGSPSQNTPVFMLTNLGQESVIKEALRTGADGYILKSKYLPNQIVDEIEKFLKEKPTKTFRLSRKMVKLSKLLR